MDHAVQADGAFADLLRIAIAAHGASRRAIGRGAGIDSHTVARALEHPAKPVSEKNIRALATYLGADPDEWALIAGYGRRPAPPPQQFKTLATFLVAACAALRIAPSRASLDAGLAGTTLPCLIANGRVPQRPTLNKIAAYFGVDRAALRALRPPHPSYVARGHRLLEERGIDWYRDAAAKGRAGVGTQTTDQRREVARIGALTGATRTRRGHWRSCLFCGDPDRLIYQNPSRALLGRRQYHGACWRAFQQHLPMRERRSATGAIGWIWSRIKFSDDGALKKRVRAEMDAYVNYLRNPKRRGRRPALMEHRDIAIAAWTASQCGCTSKEIADMLEWACGEDARENRIGGTWTREMIKRGELLCTPLARVDLAESA